jgi:hypothetical protein
VASPPLSSKDSSVSVVVLIVSPSTAMPLIQTCWKKSGARKEKLSPPSDLMTRRYALPVSTCYSV